MQLRLKAREKIEESRRNCLLKKIKFYEYLMGFGARPLDSDGLQDQRQPLELPDLIPPAPDRARSGERGREKAGMRSLEVRLTDSSDLTNNYREKKTSKSVIKESFRLSTRDTISNISELTAKSMAPTPRLSKCPEPLPEQNDPEIRTSLFSRRKVKKGSIRVSPKRRVYLAGTAYLSSQSAVSGLEQVSRGRKESICAWETEVDAFF